MARGDGKKKGRGAGRTSSPKVAPAAAPPPPVEDLFELGARLGGVTTGEVYRARERASGDAVVLKLVAPAVLELPDVARKLERELLAQAQLEDAAVVRVRATGEATVGGEVRRWIAMDPVGDGQTLQQAVAARGPLDPAATMRLVRQLGDGLLAAAERGLVHRDLAPKNVLLDGDRARLINLSVPSPGEPAGVIEYVAPECLGGRAVDQRATVYSLGAIAYFALTGSAPFEGDVDELTAAHGVGAVPALAASVEVPAPLATLVADALTIEPKHRTATVRQLLDRLAALTTPEVAPASAAAASPPSTPTPVAARPAARVEAVAVAPTPMDLVDGSATQVDPLAALAPMAAAADLARTDEVTLPPPAEVAPEEAEGKGRKPSATWDPDTDANKNFGKARWEELRRLEGAARAGRGSQPPEPARSADAKQPPESSRGRDSKPPESSRGRDSKPPESSRGRDSKPPGALPAATLPVAEIPVAAEAPVRRPAGKGGTWDPDTNPQAGNGFRETMWFKKGELDVAAAEAAAAERARGKDVDHDRADALPAEDRYRDDGSLTRSDRDKYSLATGSTQALRAIADVARGDGERRPTRAAAVDQVSEQELLAEMRGGRGKLLVAVGAGVVALVAIIAAASC
ncbi:MAG: protein kinase [Kofleriaceae bacterium]